MYVWEEWPEFFGRCARLVRAQGDVPTGPRYEAWQRAEAPLVCRERLICGKPVAAPEAPGGHDRVDGSRLSRGFSIRQLTPEQLARCGPHSPLLALTRRRPRRDIEHYEQVALFTWARAHESEITELRVLYAIPNFSARGYSKSVRLRDGARLKAEGRKKGVLDCCLPVARSPFHGLYFELKTPAGHATKEQRWWRDALRAHGYRAEIVVGWERARDLILQYLGMPKLPTRS